MLQACAQGGTGGTSAAALFPSCSRPRFRGVCWAAREELSAPSPAWPETSLPGWTSAHHVSFPRRIPAAQLGVCPSCRGPTCRRRNAAGLLTPHLSSPSLLEPSCSPVCFPRNVGRQLRGTESPRGPGLAFSQGAGAAQVFRYPPSTWWHPRRTWGSEHLQGLWGSLQGGAVGGHLPPHHAVGIQDTEGLPSTHHEWRWTCLLVGAVPQSVSWSCD